MQLLTLGEALSFTTGRLLCEPSRIMSLCSWFMGEKHFLPEARGVVAKMAAEKILRSYPELSEAVPTWKRGEGDQWMVWLSEQVDIHGNEFQIDPLTEQEQDEILAISRNPPK